MDHEYRVLGEGKDRKRERLIKWPRLIQEREILPELGAKVTKIDRHPTATEPGIVEVVAYYGPTPIGQPGTSDTGTSEADTSETSDD